MAIQIQQRLLDIRSVRVINDVKGGASLDDIKKTLEQAGEIEIQMRLSDLTASRKINSLMTAQQMSKWRAIQQKEQAEQKN